MYYLGIILVLHIHDQLSTGSTTVFVNNKGCGRIGDSISSCTSVVQRKWECFDTLGG